MSCPLPLARSMYADLALSTPEAAELERHLRNCPACTAEIDALVRERRVLTGVLRQDNESIPVPAFRRSPPWSRMLAGAAAVALLAFGPLAVWTALSSYELPAALEWLNPFGLVRAAEVAAGVLVYVIFEGLAMIGTAVEIVGLGVLITLLTLGAFAAVRTRRGSAAMMAAVLAAAVLLPSLSQALEIRKSEQVLTVPAGETIDDTLIALGENIEIDGTITGDLIAFARRVNIRGTVQGQLLTGAQTIDIDGDIGGSVIGFAESLGVGQAQIGRNLFGFGRNVTTRGDARIDGNAVIFAATGTLAAPVGVDVVGFANEVALSGEVAGDVTAYASRVTVLAPASVGGNLVAHVENQNALQVSPSATIGGTVRTEVGDGEPGGRTDSEGGLGSFYAWQAVRLGAAFLTGLIVLALVPSLGRAQPGTTGTEVLTTAAVGLVAMVAVPIIAVLTAITLIGLPIAVLMFLLWMAALYFAKILFAYFLGAKLFERARRRPHFALALIVGLLIVLTVTSVPLVGGIVNFLLTIVGLGMLVIHVWGRFNGRSFGGPDRDVLYP